jgi:hypothetical protein
MRQVIAFLEKNKNKHISILCICLFTLTSCYEFDPLPNKIRSNYELAIPIMDTTIVIGDFESFANYNDIWNTEIPEGTFIDMGELSFPFYLGYYAHSDIIEWIESQIIIDTKSFPSSTKIYLKIYIKTDNGEKLHFGLPENYPITLENSQVKVPMERMIEEIEQFRYAKRIFFNASIEYPVATSVSSISTAKMNIKFAIKFAIKTNLTVSL